MAQSVLFLCNDNSILSQMAEAFLRRYGYSSFKVYSAGIEPKAIHLYTYQVMEEIGYELYGQHAKSIFKFNAFERVDYLITLTDFTNQCLILNHEAIGQHLHWPFESPLDKPGQPREGPIRIDLPILGDDPGPLPSRSWLATVDTREETKKALRQLFEADSKATYKNNKETKEKFRSIRDQMEVQVMTWLDEKGLGPFWWRGKK